MKFILTSYRDFIVLGKDEEFLNHVYPIVKLLIEVGLEKWDVDNDGIIENSNTCDQTYVKNLRRFFVQKQNQQNFYAK